MSGKALPLHVDLLALTRDALARQRPCRGRACRMIGDRDVLVAEGMRARDHHVERIPAIAVGRVHVQIAAHVRCRTRAGS